MNKASKHSLEKRSLRSIIASAVNFLIIFAQNVAIVPLLLKHWGVEKYGIWIAVFSFFSLLQTLDLGHHDYVANEFARDFHISRDLAQEVLASGIRMCFIIGFFEVVVLLVIVYTNQMSYTLGIPAERLKDMHVAWGLAAIMTTWLLSGNIGGLLVKIILPAGLTAQSIYMGVALKAFQLLVLIAAALGNWSIFLTCLVTGVSALVYSYITFARLRKLLPQYFPWWVGGNWKTGWRNFVASMAVTMNNVLNQFSTNGLIIMVSSFLGVSMIPVFTTLRTLSNTATQGTNMLLLPLTPEMIKYHALRDGKKIIQLQEFNWLISGFIVNTGFLISPLVVQQIFVAWTKHSMTFNWDFYLFTAAAVIVNNFSMGQRTYLTGINDLKGISAITFGRFIVLFPAAFLGLKLAGLSGVGIAIFLSEVAAAVINHAYTRKVLRSIGHRFDTGIFIFCFLPVVVSMASMFLAHYFWSIRYLITGAGLLVLLVNYWQLYRSVDGTIRHRILKVLRLAK